MPPDGRPGRRTGGSGVTIYHFAGDRPSWVYG